MREFTYSALPAQVIFGAGTVARAAESIDFLGAKRPFLLSTAGQATKARAALAPLGAILAGHFDGAVMHTPVDVTAHALAALQQVDADCLIAFGGGSTIGLAKALALRTDLPQLAIPTTYAGSEMTPVLGQMEQGHKTTIRDLKVLPEAVIYDVNLTLDLPLAISAASGLNAIAHSVEGLYARDTNAIMQRFAEEAIATLASALPRIAENGRDLVARGDALYGAWLCGMVLGSVGMALHHKLCHVLGGSLGLPHAETHAIILPHALAYNAPAIPQALDILSRALQSEDPAQALYLLRQRLGLPAGLRDIGMPQEGIDRAVDLTLSASYWNPRPLDRVMVRDLLATAWAGAGPR